MSLKLVSEMPDSNRNWKNRYFFVQGTDWVCRLKEWDGMPNGFDNTWGVVRELGLSFVFIFHHLVSFSYTSNTFFFFFFVCF